MQWKTLGTANSLDESERIEYLLGCRYTKVDLYPFVEDDAYGSCDGRLVTSIHAVTRVTIHTVCLQQPNLAVAFIA